MREPACRTDSPICRNGCLRFPAQTVVRATFRAGKPPSRGAGPPLGGGGNVCSIVCRRGLQQSRRPLAGAPRQARRPTCSAGRRAGRRHPVPRQRRRQPGVVPQALGLRAAVGGVSRSFDRSGLRRVALPLQLQLPRRRLPPGGVGRGGGPARIAGPGPHRPRRHVRGGPLRRGGVGGGDADGVRGRAQPGPDQTAERGGRPRGPPRVGVGPRPRGLPAALRGDQRGAVGGQGEGQARVLPLRVGPGVGGPVAGADRVPQGHRPVRSHGRGSGRRHPPVGRPGGGLRARQRGRRVVGPRRPARLGPQRRAGRRRPPSTSRRGGDQQRPLLGAVAAGAGHGLGRGAGPAFARRDRRVAPAVRRGPPAFGSRTDPPLRPLPRCGRAGGGARSGVRLRPQTRRPPVARLPGAAGPHRDDVVAPSDRGGRHPPLRAPGQRAGAGRLRPDRPRTGPHRTTQLPRLLPHRVGHRRVLPALRHLVPGPGFGGQLGRLLRPRGHGGRRRVARPALRTLPVPRTRWSARHRRRHRERPPRGGHPVRLRTLRAAERGPGGQRHHVPAQVGGARHGQGPRPLDGATRRVVQTDRRVGSAVGHRGPTRPRDPGPGAGVGRGGAELPPSPGNPLGRHGHLRPSGVRGRARRMGTDGGAHRSAVGQGRLRRGRSGEVRPARPGHARARCITPSI